MMHHRFRLEWQAPEGCWGVIASADTIGDAFLLSEAEPYRERTKRIVDLETGDHVYLPHHHKGKHHEMAYRTSW